MDSTVVAVVILNLLIGGIIVAMYQVGRKRGNEYPYLKSYVRNINLVLIGFLASVDLAYYLNSRGCGVDIVYSLCDWRLFRSKMGREYSAEDSRLNPRSPARP
jgi:hypothetical protein